MSIGNNPIEKNINAVDVTSHFVKAVGKETYENLCQMLIWLKKRGYQNPILYGGALRDLFIGELEPKDYDFEVDFSEKADEIDPAFSFDIMIRKYRVFEKTASERALRSDAPINGIAIDLKGKVFAHPNFQEHASMGIYAIRKDLHMGARKAAIERFDRLSNKYEHWTLEV